MKQTEKCLGRGFESRQVHQKHIMKKFSKEYIEFEQKHLKELEDLWYKTKDESLRNVILNARVVLQCIFDGPAMASTGQRVLEWTTRQCESRRVGDTWP